MEREKVIKGLECLAQKRELMANPCSKCDYHDRPNFAFCVIGVATDALVLLKAQESKAVIRPFFKVSKKGESLYGICPLCKNRIIEKSNFCGNCGQAVIWIKKGGEHDAAD